MPRDVEVPEIERRTAQLELREGAAASREAAQPELLVSLSSEFPVARWWAIEVLGHEPEEVDLRAFEPAGLPLLRDHRNDVDSVVGRLVEPELRGGKLYAKARFAPHEEAQALLEKVRAGTLSEVSVGYSIETLELVHESDKRGEPSTYRATRWTPRECSLVAVPADYSVGVGRGQGMEGTRVVPVTERESAMADDVKAPAKGEGQEERAAKAAEAKREAEAAEEARRRELQDAMKADRERIAELDKLGAKFGLPRDVVERAKQNGTTVPEFNGLIIDHLGDGADQALNRASAIGMSEREVERFSLVRLIHGLASQRLEQLAPFEAEVTQTAAAAAAKDGRTIRGALVPADVMGSDRYMTPAMQARAHLVRDLVVGDKGVGTGGQLVDTTLATGSFIDLLRNRAILMQLGARVLSGLTGDVAIPKQTGDNTLSWIGETDQATESVATIGQVQLRPHTAAAWSNYSRKLLLQSSMDVEAFIRDSLANVLRIGIDHCALNGAADADAPNGIADDANINTVTFGSPGAPTWAEVIECWSEVAVDNADTGSLAYLMGPAMAGHLMSTPKVAGDGTMMMANRGDLAGYRAAISTQAAAGHLWFGNWADLIMAFWSGLDIAADPYTLATSGATRVVAFQDVDFGIRNAVSFCRGAAA